MDGQKDLLLGFLGGASAIGASCVFVSAGGLRAVVDAGVRQARGETLPDLRALQQVLGREAPDVIVLTHAHIDHSGALPVLARSWPGVPILATHATADLVRILLLDSLQIMESEREEEVPLFSAAEVERTLASVRPVGFDDPFDLPSGRVRLLPAGHILGAASALLEAGSRRVLVSGDLSVGDQRTVPGMPPPRVRPDVLVLESTYGDRLHASREAEERRLAEQVAEVVAAGGHVLVPAFAVGRAQEVLLVLGAAMRHGRIPRFPVHADGMVRAACDAYRTNPLFLGPRLRRSVLRGDDPFFPPKSGFSRVASAEEREKVISGPPCCVVASSGMLAGGASVVYARAWASRPENLIAITGYQDEEAPGRALQDLAEGSVQRISLAGGAVDWRARVATYHLSAHADADELTGLVRRIRPRSVYLVHGDRRSREALASRLLEGGETDVLLPEDGDLLAHEHRPLHHGGRAAIRGLGEGRDLTPSGLGEIRDVLLRVAAGRPRLYTAQEIAGFWFGADPGADAVQKVRDLLSGAEGAFEADRRRPYRYRPVVAAAPKPGGPAAQAEVLALLDRCLEAVAAGPSRRSVHAEERRIRIRFPFPDAVGPRVAPVLAEVGERTGWRIDVHPHADQNLLAARAREALPAEAGAGGPSFLHAGRTVRLEVRREPPDAAARAAAFREETGWSLELVVREGGDGVAAAVPVAAEGAPLLPEEVKAHLDRVFADVPKDLSPRKATYPAGEIVLHFVHPGMAVPHRSRLEDLARLARRSVRVHPHANHQALSDLVRRRLPPHWEVLRPPAWVPEAGVVRVVVWTFPPEAESREVLSGLETTLGCPVVLVQGE